MGILGTACTRVQSSPSNSAANSTALSRITPSITGGQRTHKSAVGALAGMANTKIAYHGANAGDDTFRTVDAMAVIGGMSAPPDVIAGRRHGGRRPYARL